MPDRISFIRRRRRPSDKKLYLKNIKYPEIPPSVDDIYIITTVGDRLDSLSNQFYNSVDFWWIIARANPDLFPKDSFALKPGLQLRIPANYQSIVDEFYRINENR